MTIPFASLTKLGLINQSDEFPLKPFTNVTEHHQDCLTLQFPADRQCLVQPQPFNKMAHRRGVQASLAVEKTQLHSSGILAIANDVPAWRHRCSCLDKPVRKRLGNKNAWC